MDQFAKMIIMLSVGTSYPFIFGDLIQQCMVTEVQNSTILFYQKRRHL